MMDLVDLIAYVAGIRCCVAGEECINDELSELGFSHQYQFEQILSARSGE